VGLSHQVFFTEYSLTGLLLPVMLCTGFMAGVVLLRDICALGSGCVNDR